VTRAEPKPVRVFVAMVADLFHFGHVSFLSQARLLGDHLTVGVVSDRRAASYKRRPVMSYAERRAVVEACRHVDAVLELDDDVTDAFMRAHDFHIRGYAVANAAEEQRYFATLWRHLDLSFFHRIDYTPGISTSDILERIRSRMAAGTL
jgi:cytidyltransferase-like protein